MEDESDGKKEGSKEENLAVEFMIDSVCFVGCPNDYAASHYSHFNMLRARHRYYPMCDGLDETTVSDAQASGSALTASS